MKNNNGKVYYVCFYADSEVEDKIIVYPSVLSKIDYVASRIKRTGREVVITSIAPSLMGVFDGYYKKIDSQESHVYLKSRHSKNSIVNKILFILHNLQIIFFLIKNVKKEDSVLVYHSLYNRIWLKIYKMLSSRNIILQIEDVFSELSPKTHKYRKTEWKSFKKMDKVISVNDILYDDLEEVSKKMVSYGSYELPPEFSKPHTEKIRLVYAGVIEQERNAAFLAIESMEYLSADYEMHILGFGNEKDIADLNALIANINLKKGVERVKFHGRMQGDEYFSFLQSCDIALSTHMYDESNMSSADYTFPSKIIVYLANNLRVVAQKLRVLEKCAVSEYVSFYDMTTPQAVADAIKKIKIDNSFDGRKIIADLDEKFVIDINRMLES